MAPLFEPVPDLASNESLAMMEEVFFMLGKSSTCGSDPSHKGIVE
jgi:hypothetical protein